MLSIQRTLGRPANGPGTRCADCIRLWIRRSRTRAALARLGAAGLDDIGKTRAEAGAEAQKPFWRT